jgi:hypothetical protein
MKKEDGQEIKSDGANGWALGQSSWTLIGDDYCYLKLKK